MSPGAPSSAPTTPPDKPPRPSAVVLCPPYGHELVQSHRAFRLLADRLSEAGFPTLRFDYRGTGDSAGEAGEATLEAWREDVRAATEICRARSRRKHVTAVGLRLGGSLAALEAGRAGAFDRLVLWDPVVRGAEYLAELEALEGALRQSLPSGGGSFGRLEHEYVGFPYAGLQAGLAALDLTAARVEGTTAALRIATDHEAGATPSALDLGCPVTEVAVRDPRIWMEDADKALIPREALDAIVGWLAEAYA